MVPVNVEGFRRAARRRLPKPLFDFVDGGAEDEVTERANRRQFELLRFAPRILTDVSDRSLSCEFAGVRCACRSSSPRPAWWVWCIQMGSGRRRR